MALTGPDFQDLGKSAILIVASGQTCFYCGKALEDPAWMWQGETTAIYMHISCALNLGIRISYDVWQYQKKMGRKAVST